MIVELIGCAGAGKTTLRRLLAEREIAGRRSCAMSDLVLDRPVLRRITHPTAVNVAQEIGSLPFVLGGPRSDRDFVRYARRMLAGHARSRFDEVNGLRGIVRKVGMYRLAASRAREAVVLSDEGTLLSAYNLLVMTDLKAGPEDIEAFLRVVPLPDRVVYVTAPVAALVGRAHSRPSPRRQHRGRTEVEVESDVRETVDLFDRIAASPLVADRLLVVENGDGDEASTRQVADRIAAWLESPSASVTTPPLAHALAGGSEG